MTKEKAIEWLKSLNYCDGEKTQEVAQAIEMAINALEQSTSDDCVSRQAVINLVNAECVDLQDGSEEWRSYVNETVENIYHGIKALPPVIPTFPKGETNGDIIKAIFPNAKIDINEMLGVSGIVFVDSENEIIPISQDWWNAPYKGI